MTHTGGLGRGIVPAGVDAGYREVETRPHVALTPYGSQSVRTWTAADVEPKDLLDAMRSEFLWRVSVQGENLVLQLVYGTQATIRLDALRLPFVGFVPGQAQLLASKLDPAQPANARVTLTAATGGLSTVRAVAGVGALPTNAASYTALTASTLTVAGFAGIAVAVGATLPLVAPSIVTVGDGILELTL
jgi:hypothetical protein